MKNEKYRVVTLAGREVEREFDTLEAAQKDCEDDTDWQVLCQPEKLLEREDAWQEANSRMNTGTAPASA